MTTYKEVLEENRDNAELLAALVSECSGYDGSLEDYEWQAFDEEFFDTYFSDKIEIARATYFGKIDNWNDDYIRFNAYGNLESASEYTREEELKDGADEIIDRALEMQDNIDLDWIINTYTEYDADGLTKEEK